MTIAKIPVGGNAAPLGQASPMFCPTVCPDRTGRALEPGVLPADLPDTTGPCLPQVSGVALPDWERYGHLHPDGLDGLLRHGDPGSARTRQKGAAGNNEA